MSHILSAVPTTLKNANHNARIRIRRALISVSDKTNIIDFATFLTQHSVELISTGGTARALRDSNLPVTEVSDYTGFPEILDGRVKSLHPKIHAGLLAVRDNAEHERQMEEHSIQAIDLIVLNLYPFENAVRGNNNFDTCVENIDIGGPSMLRSAAKNHRFVLVCSSPSQYLELMQELRMNDFETSYELRRRFATEAFALSAKYDTAISLWMQRSIAPVELSRDVVVREYKHEMNLKYGCNPHQKPASIYSIAGCKLPFEVLNGTPGYINLLDAMNAYQLVRELKNALNLPAASSFKHVSPAGAAVAVELGLELHAAYEVGNAQLTPLSLAYLRARNADPLSSFGDFVALSDKVDAATANILKREVSDGIIAPAYDAAALEILKGKKNGNFIVLQADADFLPPQMEYREICGVIFAQKRNDALLTKECLSNIQTPRCSSDSSLSEAQIRDLLLAAITLKYTQSNSIGYAKDGQMIGVGAGQQSRVDCVKLAGRKLAVWHLRQHPKVQNLQFKSGVKRQDRVNARVRYIEGDMAAAELSLFQNLFEEIPAPLTADEKATFLSSLTDVSLASDAFFPFRDSIDHASKLGVKYIIQPGGSNRDEEVREACEEYGITMAFSNLRLFHH